jgi:hypothetical protein
MSLLNILTLSLSLLNLNSAQAFSTLPDYSGRYELTVKDCVCASKTCTLNDFETPLLEDLAQTLPGQDGASIGVNATSFLRFKFQKPQGSEIPYSISSSVSPGPDFKMKIDFQDQKGGSLNGPIGLTTVITENSAQISSLKLETYSGDRMGVPFWGIGTFTNSLKLTKLLNGDIKVEEKRLLYYDEALTTDWTSGEKDQACIFKKIQ